jgi:iduronate 2-sulfatase
MGKCNLFEWLIHCPPFRKFAAMKAMLAALLVSAASLVSAKAAKPNVLFVAVDDLKPTIACYGDKLAKTPNIDRVAATGTLFERAYCMQALCSPSRNALLTGLRPEVLKIYDLGTNFRKRVPDVETLPQWFKRQGYASHGIGKIFHVGHGNHEDEASWSVPHFQAKTVGYALPQNRAKLTREEALFANEGGDVSKLPRGAAYESADVADDAYADGQIANESIKRLREFKESGAPFFLAVGFLRPHLPFCSPKKYWDLYDPSAFPLAERKAPPDGAPEFALQFGGELRQYASIPEKGPMPEDLQRTLIHGYYAAVSYMDAQLGRVLDELEKLGLAENTIVILWGDHGWHLGDHGMWCKHTNYEQATHAPLLISAPGRRTPQRTAALVEFVDIYPTLCDLAGLEKPAHLQGESLIPILDKPASKRTAAFQVYPRNPKETGPLLGYAVRTDRWRYVEWRKADETANARELYDLRNDPQETVNVAGQPDKSEVVNEHAALLKARLAKPAPAGLKLLDLAAQNPAPKVDREALFAKKDKNGDGKLTRDEFLADQPDPEEAPKRFPKFDTNGDGVLTREEFVAAGAKR